MNTLVVEGASLQDFTRNEISELPNLVEMKLIRCVEFNELPDFPKLQEITLTGDRLTDEGVDRLFGQLSKSRLSSVDLSNNNLTVYPRALNNFPKLDTVRLGQNGITSLDGGDPLRLRESVREIDLSRNRIAMIESADVFDGTLPSRRKYLN